MSRYIEVDAVIARIAGQMSYEIEVENGNEIDCVDLAEELLNDIPSIDIEPKRGEWKLFYESKDGDNVYKCSCCRFITVIPEGIKLFSFCPNCGADMRGE